LVDWLIIMFRMFVPRPKVSHISGDGEEVELQEVVTQTDGGKKTLQRDKAGTKE